MSTPHDPYQPDQPDQAPTGGEAPDAQPTEAYSEAAPTQAYPPADQPAYAQPAYGQAPQGQPAYGQPAYGQPAYGQPAYGQPAAPAGPDTRPKRLGWVALGLGIAAVVLMIISWFTFFIAFAGIVIAALALLAGTAAIVFGIIVLVKKTQGFKPGGIVGIAGGVLAGLAWISLVISIGVTAVFVSLGDSSSPLPAPSSSASAEPEDEPSDEPSDEPTDGASTEPSAAPGDETGTPDTAAYIAEVRPQIEALMASIDPMYTPEMVSTAFSDDMLVTLGESFAIFGSLEGMQAQRGAIVDSFVTSGLMDEAQAGQFFDIIANATAAHLM